MSETVHVAISETTPTELATLFERSGWIVSSSGQVMAARRVPGFIQTPVMLRYGLEASRRLIEEGGYSPLVVSRYTPESQRVSHLERAITVEDGQRSDSVPMSQLATDILDQEGVDVQIDLSTPMIDCIVLLPLVNEGQQIYFAGHIESGIRSGLSIVFDRGFWNSSLWVTQEVPRIGSTIPIAITDDREYTFLVLLEYWIRRK